MLTCTSITHHSPHHTLANHRTDLWHRTLAGLSAVIGKMQAFSDPVYTLLTLLNTIGQGSVWYSASVLARIRTHITQPCIATHSHLADDDDDAAAEPIMDELYHESTLKSESLFRSQVFAQVASLSFHLQASAHYALVRNAVFLAWLLGRIRDRLQMSSEQASVLMGEVLPRSMALLKSYYALVWISQQSLHQNITLLGQSSAADGYEIDGRWKRA